MNENVTTILYRIDDQNVCGWFLYKITINWRSIKSLEVGNKKCSYKNKGGKNSDSRSIKT